MAGQSEARTPVVCDAGPLIHLDEIGGLDLLAGFAALVVPDAVWQETERHRPGALDRAPLPMERRTVNEPPAPNLAVMVTSLSLDAGETEALQVLAELDQPIFLTDDLAARTAAKALGVETHGTIGIIVRAIRAGFRTAAEVVALLEAIPRQTTLHLRPALLADVVQEVKDAHGLP